MWRELRFKLSVSRSDTLSNINTKMDQLLKDTAAATTAYKENKIRAYTTHPENGFNSHRQPTHPSPSLHPLSAHRNPSPDASRLSPA